MNVEIVDTGSIAALSITANVLQLTAVNYFKNSRNEYRNNKL